MVSEIEIQRYRRLAAMAKRHVAPFPGNGRADRGIVICGGGARYFTCAWVCINLLRRHGCQLPIELWYLDTFEFDSDMRHLVSGLGVTCVNAAEINRGGRRRNLGGWELKPFSVAHSRFEQVLFLDADNVPVTDPTYLFDSPPYIQHGAVFWPDFGRLAPQRDIWRICNVAYRNEPEFESGQMLIHRRRCWQALSLTMHLNDHSDFYYRHIHGDKDTFHMAWRMLGQEYAMVPYGIHALPSVMCQHDFDGKIIFQHRNLSKWNLSGSNPRIAHFQFHDECISCLRELKDRWEGKVRYKPMKQNPTCSQIEEQLLHQRRFVYERIGYDNRVIELLADGQIGLGRMPCEQRWRIDFQSDGEPWIEIIGESRTTCRLRPHEKGWKGRWLSHERMRVLLRADEFTLEEKALYSEISQSNGFIYERVGHDKRMLQLDSTGLINVGSADCERFWSVECPKGEIPRLLIVGDKGTTCILRRVDQSTWEGQWLHHERMSIHLRSLANTPEAGQTSLDHVQTLA